MKKDDDLKKVVLIGTGLVGMSMAYSVLNTGGIDELVLIDWRSHGYKSWTTL